MANIAAVTRLSDLNGSTLSISPEQAIQDLQEFLEENPNFDKVVLIAINNRKQDFKYAWFKGRTLTSEAIVALNLTLNDQLDALS